MKVSFLLIYVTVLSLMDNSVISFSRRDLIKSQELKETYYGYLEATGWTEQSFDQELLNLIDRNW